MIIRIGQFNDLIVVLAEKRVITVGAGPSRPVAANDTAAGRQQNRRVELTIVPNVEK